MGLEICWPIPSDKSLGYFRRVPAGTIGRLAVAKFLKLLAREFCWICFDGRVAWRMTSSYTFEAQILENIL